MSSPYARELIRRLEVQEKELQLLRSFFKEVAGLTLNHHGITITQPGGATDDYAIVYPSELAKALEKVDPNWADPKRWES